MAFMKNIIDLIGILTFMVLTVPSIAANVDCNGKPFHCVNSTHFMICVDVGSGVSSTIDDFVIPCPPTTVCKGTNRFECEFPAVTTTVATSVAPHVTSVSETMVTVTTPIYEVITSIPFEEYYNILSTTLSEDVLITHQTIATEPTVTESTIRVTDGTQNIELSGYESNATLSEIIKSVNVVQNDLTTLTSLSNNASANVTESIPDTTENLNVTTPESETSVKVVQNDLTTLTPLLNNTYTSAADLIPNATESETKSNTTDTILSATDNAQTEPTLSASTSSALPILVNTTTASVLAEVTETTLGESTLSDTNPSVDINLTEFTVFTIFPDNISVNATVLNLDATESSSILTDFKTNSILTDGIFLDVAQNESTPLSISNSSTLIISIADTITESILSHMTETTPSISAVKETIPIVDFIPNDVTIHTPLPDYISGNTTDLIKKSTENVSETEKNTISSKTTSSLDVGQNVPPSLLPNDLSDTDFITDVKDNLNEAISESEANSPSNETIPTKTKYDKNQVPHNILGSTSLPINITDTVSVLLEVKETTPSEYIDVVRNDVTTLNTSSNTAFPDNIVDIATESVITGMTENVQKTESNLNLSGSTPSMPVTDIILQDHTTLETPSETVLQSNITTEPTLSDVTPKINTAITESIHKSSTKTITTTPVSSSTASLSNTDVLVAQFTITNGTDNSNFAEAESNSNLTSRRNLTRENENIVQNDIPPLNTQQIIDLQNTSEPLSNKTVFNTLVNKINKANTTDNHYSIETERNRTIKVFLTPAEGSQTISTMTDTRNITVDTTTNTKVEIIVSPQRVSSITVSTDTENIEINNQIDKEPILNENILSTDITDSGTAATPILIARNENLFTSSLVLPTDIPVPRPTTKVTFTPITDTLAINELTFLTTNQESNIQVATTLGGEINDIILPITTLEHVDTSKPFEIAKVSTNEFIEPKYATTTVSSNYLPLPHLFPNTTSVDNIEERPALTDYNVQQTTNSPVDVSTIPTIDITVINDFIATEQTTMAATFTVTETSEVTFSETLPTALSSEKATENEGSNKAIENHAVNDKNTENSTNKSNVYTNVTINDEPKLLTINSKLMNTDSIVHVYPITEIIMTEVENKSHVETPKNIESFKSKLHNTTDFTQSTKSSLLVDNAQFDTATSASIGGKSGYKEVDETLNPKLINNTSPNKVTAGDFSTHVNDNVSSVGLAQQELYTESTINYTDANFQTPLSNNYFSKEAARTIESGDQGTTSAVRPDTPKGLFQLTSENHAHTLDITQKTKETVGLEKIHQSPINNIPIQTPYQDITISVLTDILEQAPAANTSENNQITVLEQPPIDNSKTKLTQDVFITKGIPIRTVGLNDIKVTNTLNIGNIENNVMVPKQAQNTEIKNSTTLNQHIGVSKPSQSTRTVETQMSQGISTESQIGIAMTPPVTYVQNDTFAKRNKDSSDTSTTEPITEPWKTVVTKPYMEITSQFITEQPMIERTSTEPQVKIPMISETTTQTFSRPNVGHVVSITESQAQYTNPSILDANSGTGVKSTNEQTTEFLNEVKGVSEYTDETFSNSNLVKVTSHPREELINMSKNNIVSQTTVQLPTPETESINIPKEVVTQPTRKEVTPNSLNTNRDAHIVIVDIEKTNVPVLVENIPLTHSGISVLQKPPRKSKNEQNEKPEWSESLEGSEVVKKERDSEAPESNEGKNIVMTANREIKLVRSKGSKTSTGQINEQSVNENIDLTSTPKTWDSSLNTNKISLKRAIEVTTKKVDENSNSNYQAIINIEMVSTTVKSTNNFAPAKVALVSSDLNEKSANNESTINLSIVSNVTSNIKNSTARYSPKIKSQFANTHNESVPAFESTTISFVCKQNSRGRISDSKDCRKFYICIGKSEPIEGLCPNNTVFSELKKQCTKNLSHCVRNHQFQCISEGRFSDYLNDNIYYICAKNNVGTFIRFKLQCQSNYHLNKTAVRCALNTETSQSTSQQSKSDISKSNSDQSVSSGKSEKLVVESVEKFECKKEGRFPDANDCRKYYVCAKRGKSQYRRRSKKCDSDELFHKDEKKCVDADSYECS